jgi:hypothetical protein
MDGAGFLTIFLLLGGVSYCIQQHFFAGGDSEDNYESDGEMRTRIRHEGGL